MTKRKHTRYKNKGQMLQTPTRCLSCKTFATFLPNLHQAERIRSTIRHQSSLHSCNYHGETAENGLSCVRPQLHDGSINRDSLWASGQQQS